MKRREFLNGVVGTALGVAAVDWANVGVFAAESAANGVASTSGNLPKNVVRRGEYRNSWFGCGTSAAKRGISP